MSDSERASFSIRSTCSVNTRSHATYLARPDQAVPRPEYCSTKRKTSDSQARYQLPERFERKVFDCPSPELRFEEGNWDSRGWLQSLLPAPDKSSSLRRLRIQLHRQYHVFLRDRPTIGSPRQPRENLAGNEFLLSWLRLKGFTSEQGLGDRSSRYARGGRFDRADDGDFVQCWVYSRMSMPIVRSIEGLSFDLQERRTHVGKGYTYCVKACIHLQSHSQIRIHQCMVF